MIRSMTAYARQDRQTDGLFTWELRSVNHRYLEIYVRLPEDLRPLESGVRERVGHFVKRGKVECVLSIKAVANSGGQIQVNKDVAADIARLSRELDGLIYNPAPISSLDLMRWPGVIETPKLDMDSLGKEVLASLEVGLAELVETREREGAKLQQVLQSRCKAMHEQIAIIRERLPQVLQGLRTRLLNRFEELQLQLDAERLEQEMVMLAQRLDVDEETQRLDAHIDEVMRILASKDDKPAGRRLDFLMQELNREANTVCSKSMDTETTKAGVELKVLIEQMREQVQNIE